VLIVVMTAFLMIGTGDQPVDDRPAAASTEELEAKLVLAQEALAPGTGANALEALPERQTPMSVIRRSIVMAAVEGPVAGRTLLVDLWPGTESPQLTEDQESLVEALDRVFDGETAGAAADLVESRLGWFGRLAIGASMADGQARDAGMRPFLQEAASMVVLWTIALGCLGLVGLLGLVLLILRLVAVWAGRVPRRLSAFGAHDGVYAETFALWMIVFFVSMMVAGTLAGGVGKSFALGVTGFAFLASLVALVWPVFRGVPWPCVRRDIGWTSGQGLLTELGAGFMGYAMAVPIVSVGLVITLLLIMLAAPDGDAGAAAHPIVGELASAGWSQRLQVLFLASVAAPVVEETMFRGVLYRQLRSISRQWALIWSVLVSAGVSGFIFAAIHPQGVLAIPVLAAMGVALALGREWRGSLLAPMTMHGLSNGLVMVMLMIMVA